MDLVLLEKSTSNNIKKEGAERHSPFFIAAELFKVGIPWEFNWTAYTQLYKLQNKYNINKIIVAQLCEICDYSFVEGKTLQQIH